MLRVSKRYGVTQVKIAEKAAVTRTMVSKVWNGHVVSANVVRVWRALNAEATRKAQKKILRRVVAIKSSVPMAEITDGIVTPPPEQEADGLPSTTEVRRVLA